MKPEPRQAIAGCADRYGTVSEVTVSRKDTGDRHELVVKRVQAPVGGGVSHERKLKSYQA